MDARHASLGRRTLEEIRQKRAAERLSKTSSGPDLSNVPTPNDFVGMKKSESSNRFSETDISGLVCQLKDMQEKNAERKEENKKLISKLQATESENNMLQKRLNDLEQTTVPSLRKALKDVAMEKDAAVVAREDLSAQLRTIKKRMKEAEEEQYRAEEDAAALRAELNSLQQQMMNGSHGGLTLVSPSLDRMQDMEKELAVLKSQLEQESLWRKQGQQKLAEEQAQISAIISENHELEARLAAMSERASEGTSEKITHKALTMEDKERLEKQLHDMAVAIERLESSRQKLLMEIDSQSSEIERLFEENSNLSSVYQETMSVAVHWENQVKDCLKQNEDLRGVIDKLRTEQASMRTLSDSGLQRHLQDIHKENENEAGPQAHTSEIVSLKGLLAKEQSRAEALSAEVLKLSARLQQTTQAYSTLTRLYKPVLRNIENGLIKMRREGSVAVQ